MKIISKCPPLKELKTELEVCPNCGIGFSHDDECYDCKDSREVCQEPLLSLSDCDSCGMGCCPREGLTFPVSGLNEDNRFQCYYVCEDCYNKVKGLTL